MVRKVKPFAGAILSTQFGATQFAAKNPVLTATVLTGGAASFGSFGSRLLSRFGGAGASGLAREEPQEQPVFDPRETLVGRGLGFLGEQSRRYAQTLPVVGALFDEDDDEDDDYYEDDDEEYDDE